MKSQDIQKQFVFFLAGFLLGVLYIYFSGDENGGGLNYFSEQNLFQIQFTEIVYEKYFFYLLKNRMMILAVLAVLSLALAGRYLLSGVLMLFGCSVGSMLSVLILRYGLEGLLLFFAFLFPQDFVYFPVLFGWVTVLTEWNEGMFGMKNRAYRISAGKRHVGLRVLFLLVVTIIGILLECYVNPVIVKWCLKIF